MLTQAANARDCIWKFFKQLSKDCILELLSFNFNLEGVASCSTSHYTEAVIELISSLSRHDANFLTPVLGLVFSGLTVLGSDSCTFTLSLVMAPGMTYSAAAAIAPGMAEAPVRLYLSIVIGA